MRHIRAYRLFEEDGDVDMDVLMTAVDYREYTINDDGTVDVDGNVRLDNRGLTKLPARFGTVAGDFYCGANKLTSLEGAPREVGKNFHCGANELTDLRGAPEKVGGYFMVSGNELTSLEGCPRTINGDFYCDGNRLTSLEGGPDEVINGSYYCASNRLTSLEGAPRRLDSSFYCARNPVPERTLNRLWSVMSGHGIGYMEALRYLYEEGEFGGRRHLPRYEMLDRIEEIVPEIRGRSLGSKYGI